MKLLVPLTLVFYACAGFAQSAAEEASGTEFANSIASTSNSQIVNPSGVSSTAWSSGTGISTSTPTGLGGFSTPNTSSSYLTQAQASSLTALGNQAMTDCASYTAGSDDYQNQYCAAVNFLADSCFTPTSSEASILGNTASSYGATANCSGTYGAGQSQYEYGNSVTSSDSVFDVIGGLADSASDTLSNTCTTSTVVTTPAQYETNTCIVSTDETENSCSQSLNATITDQIEDAAVSNSCADGSTLVNGTECAHTVTFTPTVSCPDGYVPSGENECVETATIQATDTCPSDMLSSTTSNGTMVCIVNGSVSDPPPNPYEGLVLAETPYCFGGLCYLPIYYPLASCPDGYTSNGTECTKTTTIGSTETCDSGYTLSGDECTQTTTTSADVTYSCPSGETLSGTSCIKKTVSTTWTDTCTAYEQASGVSLATPTN